VVEVRAVVLFWKDGEYERVKEMLGDDVEYYMTFAWYYLRVAKFPDEKWASHEYDNGLALAVAPTQINEITAEEMGEAWIGGYLFYKEGLELGASEDEIRRAIREGRVIFLHPKDHLDAFRIFCFFSKRISRFQKELEARVKAFARDLLT